MGVVVGVGIVAAGDADDAAEDASDELHAASAAHNINRETAPRAVMPRC
jgi:hypothetical protein